MGAPASWLQFGSASGRHWQETAGREESEVRVFLPCDCSVVVAGVLEMPWPGHSSCPAALPGCPSPRWAPAAPLPPFSPLGRGVASSVRSLHSWLL